MAEDLKEVVEIKEKKKISAKEKRVLKKQAKQEKRAKKIADKSDNVNVKSKRIRTGYIKFLQHICITAAAVSAFVAIAGAFIVVPSYNGEKTYILSSSDEKREYDESVLFNTILGSELSSVLRLVTIETQVESDGRYDSSIVIDVQKYNSRNNVQAPLASDIKVEYYLGDLLKWAKYGFNSNEYTYDQLSAAGKMLVANEIDGNYKFFYNPDADDDGTTYYIMANRYKTVDGKCIEELASSWAEYQYICDQVMLASNDLYNNYIEYLQLADYFDMNASNIRYCVINGSGTNSDIYTNVDIKGKNISQIKKEFEEYGRYICYDSDKMIYTTNTAVSEALFNSLINPYKYAFSEDGYILVAVDTNFTVNDSFTNGKVGYMNCIPYYSLLICAVILALALYLLLLFIGIVKEGRIINPDGSITIRQTSFDNTAIELWIIISAILFFIPWVIGYLIYNFDLLELTPMYELYTRVGIGCFAFLYDVVCLALFYSLVRRIKGKNIWKHSWLHGICVWIAKTSYFIFDNSSTLIRSVLPFGLLVLVNGIIGGLAIFQYSLLPICIVLILFIDIFAAVIIYRQANTRKKLINGLNRIISGEFDYKQNEQNLHGDNVELAKSVNSIGNSVRQAVEQSMMDEKMKTELVANVSHDIRTPLTSIINYVDLLKRENIQNENIQNYISVLDEKSQRLKQLTEDLIEVSKVTSGNIELDLQKMVFPELINQALGEFEDKFEEKNLTSVCRADSLTNGYILADGKSLWRVMENLLSNIYKYSMPGTRVFLDLFNVSTSGGELVVLQIKNMSATPLPANTAELTERFARGDQSRTTEGSGLGLSIAKSLIELMGGTFEIDAEADLFKVELSFKSVQE